MDDPKRLQSLPEIEAAIWRELAASAVDRSHPWRIVVLATAAAGGADARIVIMREVDEASRSLVFYTDARSAKVQQLVAQPGGTLVMWSPQLRWQLRARATLSVQTAGLAVSSRWARLSVTPAALDYLAPRPPGDPVVRPSPERGTRNHFAVMTARVTSIDWLELHNDGHRRARFADDHPARWLQP